MDFILRWIFVNKVDLSGVDFVCWRGLLTKLLTTPFENREGWIIGASKFRGTWFLHDFPTEAKKLREAQMTEEQKVWSGWEWVMLNADCVFEREGMIGFDLGSLF